tara:strand:+ start:96 stop:344 length:249 start_codon:yes stop_codon:yes gene_type:complete
MKNKLEVKMNYINKNQREVLESLPILNSRASKFLSDFSVLCEKHLIDEHIVLENENIRKQFGIKEDYKTKLKNIETILKGEF